MEKNKSFRIPLWISLGIYYLSRKEQNLNQTKPQQTTQSQGKKKGKVKKGKEK